MTWTHPVVPVVTVPTPEVAVPLARALAAGGLAVIEVTLRSAAALEAIVAIRAELPDVVCGAGTLLSAADVKAVVEAGAQFLVSPGSTDGLVEAMLDTALPALPGVATPTEAMRLHERGLSLAKLFPAEAVGGVDLLKALAGPLPEMRFCATGGITAESAPAYLALPNVAAVGGSWMVPREALVTEDWQTISRLAAESAAMVSLSENVRRRFTIGVRAQACESPRDPARRS